MKLLLGIVVSLCLIGLSPVNASHHYIWNNDDFICWLDDSSIQNDKDLYCIFKIIMEDRHKQTYSISNNPVIIYKSNNSYWMTILDGYCPQKEVSYYKGWWQPYGLKWLQENGYLN